MMRQFTVEASANVLVVEDDMLERVGWFRERLPQATIVRSARAAMEALKGKRWQYVFLDRDILDGFGEDVAQFMIAAEYSGRVVVHSHNPAGASFIVRILRAAGICTAVAAFGSFELELKSERTRERKIGFEELIGELMTSAEVGADNPICPRCNKSAAVWTQGICGYCFILQSHEGELRH